MVMVNHLTRPKSKVNHGNHGIVDLLVYLVVLHHIIVVRLLNGKFHVWALQVHLKIIAKSHQFLTIVG